MELDEILARGTLGRPRHDEILRRVLRRTEPPLQRWKRRGLMSVGALGAALGVWALLLRPHEGTFTARGLDQAGTASGAIEIGCGPTGQRFCREGSTLMFQVNSAVVSGYLGAYAESLTDPARPRIWYFPTSTGSPSPQVVAGDRTIVLGQGIKIGPEHAPGRYRVTVWMSTRPVQRTDIDGAEPGLVRDRTTLDLEVMP